MTLEENNIVGSGVNGFTFSKAKLDNILVGRYLSLEDNVFVENVVSDVQHFLNLGEEPLKSVLIFPPVNNYRRFLIHKICEEITCKELGTFSVGQGLNRRTVVCLKSLIRASFNQSHDQSWKHLENSTSTKMVVERQPLSSENSSPEHNCQNESTKRVRSAPAIYRPPAARKLEALQMKQNLDAAVQMKQTPSKIEKTRSVTRQRRPDLQVYVPRAKRASMMDQNTAESSNESKEIPSVENQVLCGIRKHQPTEPGFLQSSPHSSINKPYSLASSLAVQSDVESGVVSKKMEVDCDGTNKKLNNSSEHIQTLQPLSEHGCVGRAVSSLKNSNYVSNISGLQFTDLTQNNSESSEVKSIKADSFCSSNVSNFKVLNEFDILNDTDTCQEGNKYSEGSSCSESKVNDNCDQCIANQQCESDNGQINNITVLSQCSDSSCKKTLFRNVNMDENDVVRDNKDVEKYEKPQKSKSVTDVVIISDPEISINVCPKNEKQKIESIVKESNTKNSKSSPQNLANSDEKSVLSTNTSKTTGAAAAAAAGEPVASVVSLNPEECTWDMLFDDNGDCLDPKIMEELTSAVGCVTIEKPQSDYKRFLSKQDINLPGGDDEYAHVVEIYNFPPEFKTQDLLTIFAAFKNGGFEIKWVDDTHALGVFSSCRVAADVLAYDHPLVKTRPMSEATPESRLKARRSAEFLQPYRPRPETCAALARRLVTGALGMKISTSREEREAERRLLKEAREKKKLAARQQQDAWEGTIRGSEC